MIFQAGLLETNYYDSLVGVIKTNLELPRPIPGERYKEHQPAAEVRVAKEEGEFFEILENQSVDIVILISVNMIEFARTLLRRHPKLKVFVFPGRQPEGEPYIVPKIVISAEFFDNILNL